MHNILGRLFRKRYIATVLAAMLLFAIIGEAYNYFILLRFQSMSITLNYPGSESGLNPDGSRFNISEIKSDEVLEKAKSKMKNQDFTTEFLRTRIAIGAKQPQSSIEETVSAIQGGETYTYIPAAFSIYYSQKNKLAANEAHAFLVALSEVYQEYFYERYTEKNTVLKFDGEEYDFSDYEYAEIYTILQDKINSMVIYLSSHQNENNAFKSSDGYNFGTIISELETLRDIDLMKYQAYVIQNQIAKSKSTYVNKLTYLLDETTRQHSMSQGASDITKNALNKYDPSITGVAFVPSVDDTNSFYMSRTKTGIDDLAKNSYNKGIEAAGFKKDIDSYNNLLTKFSSASGSTADQKKSADSMISQISNYLTNISEKALALDNEYLEYKTKNYLTFKITGSDKIINFGLMVKFGFIGLILGLCAVLFMEFALPVLLKQKSKLGHYIRMMARIKRDNVKKKGAEK